MGLDNGIILKKASIPEGVEVTFDQPSYMGGDYEVAYWRKCWGLRNDIVELLRKSPEEEEFEYELSEEGIDKILTVLKAFNNENFWNYRGDSIWEWDDIKDTLKKQIKDIEELGKLKKAHPEIVAYFYDSY